MYMYGHKPDKRKYICKALEMKFLINKNDLKFQELKFAPIKSW